MGRKSKVNRRDFLKLLGCGAAVLVVPKVVIDTPEIVNVNRITGQYDGGNFDTDKPETISPELAIALRNCSMMRLDALGISAAGLDSLSRNEWRNEVLRRHLERLNND